MKNKLSVVGCGHRLWAIKIFEYLQAQPDIDLVIIRSSEDVTLEVIDGYVPDVLLFYGWDWRVPADIVGKYLCLGLHPSPLPKYRGANSIQHQIMNGEIRSSVSIFRMNGRLDSGDLCSQEPFSLDGDLMDIFGRVTDIGKLETARILKDNHAGQLKFWPQQGEESTFKKMAPEESEITEEELKCGTARYLYNKVRCNQYPNAYIVCGDGSKLYLTESRCEEGD